jgi:5-methylcytosine-specific restriction endonuclease McrA
MRRNPGKARDAMRRWRERHPSEHNEDSRAYYAKHREALAAYFARYQRTHLALRRALAARRRARKVAASGIHYSAAQWIALVKFWGGRCAYCGNSGPLEADHRVPLARGGANDIGNILPACAGCNQRKHVMTEDDFRVRMRQEGRGLRPQLRPALCPKHRKEQPGDQEERQQS